MRGGADTRGLSLKAIDFAARLPRMGGALSPARAARVVTGALAVALAVAAVQEGLDIRWAVGAATQTESAGDRSSRIRSSQSAARSSALQTLVNAHLFGVPPAPDGRLSTAAAQRDTTLVLTGTIAMPDAAKGFALIGTSAETAHVHPVGDSLASGAVLRAVYRDHVIVDRAGQLSAVFFPRNGKGAFTAGAARLRATPAGGARGGTDVDGEELQREQVAEAIEAESERTAAFVRQQPFYSDNQLRGIALQPGSDPAMLAQLGLKAGDVLEFINGSPIAEPDRLDWLRQRLQSGESVELSVIRPGSGEVEVKIPGGAVAGMIEN